MKTVVITGSARGFGYEMIRLFKENNFNVVIMDVNKEELDKAYNELLKLNGSGKVLSYVCDVTSKMQVDDMIKKIYQNVETIDIWINNAGVNQADKYFWELEENMINKLIDIDLKGTMICSNTIIPYMLKQENGGAIYNVEGHGSNDAKIPKLTLYGTAKRGLTYFTESLAKEVENTNVIVGKITPGIMMTNFVKTSLGDGEKITMTDKNKKIYNILGDYPETIAAYIVPKVINNKSNNAKFVWLTTFKAFKRFTLALFKKRDIFK